MTDPPEEKTPAPTPVKPVAEAATLSGFAPITSQQEFDLRISERLARQEDYLRRQITEDVAQSLAKEAAERAAKEQGDFKVLYEQSEDKAVKLAEQLAERDLADLKQKVAAKHQLPAFLAHRLVGTTEQELESDAKQLATAAKSDAVDTDAGKRSVKPNGSEPPLVAMPSFGSTNFVARPGFEEKKE
jgi:hypothetical protein